MWFLGAEDCGDTAEASSQTTLHVNSIGFIPLTSQSGLHVGGKRNARGKRQENCSDLPLQKPAAAAAFHLIDEGLDLQVDER